MRIMSEEEVSWASSAARLVPALLSAFLGFGCTGRHGGVYAARSERQPFQRMEKLPALQEFVPGQSAPSRKYASPGEVGNFSEAADQSYKVGPGDRFSFMVRGRPDISRDEIIVSPDGEITLPRAGVMQVAGRSLKQISEELTQALKQYYDEPEVTLVMRGFANNRVFVLGRVANPGAVSFTGKGTLLEALSLAGGLPVDTSKSFLSRCMIVRGNQMVIWIDLRDLLENGNMALNASLQNRDVIFIPQSEDQVAYVLGQVHLPGVHLLRSSQTVLDAIMSHGGATKDADLSGVYLARQVNGKGMVERINLGEICAKGDFRRNFVLKEGDLIYVGEKGLSRFNYALLKLLPSMAAVDFGIRSAESFGALAELRKRIWGQEGFVNTTVVPGSASSNGK